MTWKRVITLLYTFDNLVIKYMLTYYFLFDTISTNNLILNIILLRLVIQHKTKQHVFLKDRETVASGQDNWRDTSPTMIYLQVHTVICSLLIDYYWQRWSFSSRFPSNSEVFRATVKLIYQIWVQFLVKVKIKNVPVF